MKAAHTTRMRSLCLCAFLLLAAAGCGGDDDVINPSPFTDPALRLAVSQAVGKPAWQITRFDVQNLRSLDASGLGVASLDGLEVCTGLYELYLDRNRISDLAPLAGLTGLTWLSLSANEVWELSPLAGLVNLGDLFLDHNNVTGLLPLAGLTALTSLHIGGNLIGDIAPLAAMTGLVQLMLQDNQVSSIQAVQGMVRLSQLNLDSNEVVDAQPLVLNASLGSGDQVYLRGNPLSDTSCDTYVPQLEGRDVTVLSDCP